MRTKCYILKLSQVMSENINFLNISWDVCSPFKISLRKAKVRFTISKDNLSNMRNKAAEKNSQEICWNKINAFCLSSRMIWVIDELLKKNKRRFNWYFHWVCLWHDKFETRIKMRLKLLRFFSAVEFWRYSETVTVKVSCLNCHAAN